MQRPGGDVRDQGEGILAVASQRGPRGLRRVVRRYKTYLRLLVASLAVGLAVGVGSWWYFMPPATAEIPETCFTWNYLPNLPQMSSSRTDCMLGTHSEHELSRTLFQYEIIRMWPSTTPIQVDPGDWPALALRNGLIAAALAYLLLLLVVVPARVLKRPD